MILLENFLKNKRVQKTLNTKPGEEGFSLVELVVVIAVLAILSAVAIPAFVGVQANARASAVKNGLVNGVKEYGGHIMIKHQSDIVSFINASANTMFKKFFEIELNFSNGRIKIENDNDSYLLYKFVKSKNFKKYYELKKIKKWTNNINYQRIKNMYKYARKLIENNDLKNTYAIESARVLKIINSFHK